MHLDEKPLQKKQMLKSYSVYGMSKNTYVNWSCEIKFDMRYFMILIVALQKTH